MGLGLKELAVAATMIGAPACAENDNPPATNEPPKLQVTMAAETMQNPGPDSPLEEVCRHIDEEARVAMVGLGYPLPIRAKLKAAHTATLEGRCRALCKTRVYGSPPHRIRTFTAEKAEQDCLRNFGLAR